MGDVTLQGENARTELFYKSKLSLTPKRKVSSPPGRIGRLCEEGKFQFDYFPSHRKIKLFTSHL